VGGTVSSTRCLPSRPGTRSNLRLARHPGDSEELINLRVVEAAKPNMLDSSSRPLPLPAQFGLSP
jgi:hypothetical protein